ncbi:MAG: hypothetical protein J7465_12375 [Chloroflexus sp.]|nr:hypothetical protein [Chloroflexus sp.]MBO9374256.1 hypothetical protein [Chloroflexus sp.]
MKGRVAKTRATPKLRTMSINVMCQPC